MLMADGKPDDAWSEATRDQERGAVVIWVSAAEPAPLRALGTYDVRVEQWGVDFVLFTDRGLVGIQRKAYGDLLASLRGDRIARELAQIVDSPLVETRFVLEGTDRDLAKCARYAPSFRYEVMGFTEMLSARGIGWAHTRDVEETAGYLTRLKVWVEDEAHADRRLVVPKPRGSSSLERLLMQLPGCSLTRARIIAGAHPKALGWGITYDDLIALDGIGPKTARRLMESL